MTMPAGRYYVGDLCYVMHNEWDEAVSLMFPDNHSGRAIDGEFVLKDGRRFANFGTSWGDGEYTSNIQTRHLVDSGSIGCIRVEDIQDDTYDNIETLGAVVEFDQPFEVSEDSGLISFGTVEIETNPEYEFDE